jgi:Zn finger protein HypA/HybF involved in hydrogenase expression
MTKKVIHCKSCEADHDPDDIEFFDPVTGKAVCPDCDSVLTTVKEVID